MASFPYRRAAYEVVPCNICGSLEHEHVAFRDRNRLRVTTSVCTKCGLLFISPRMSQEWYSRYYKTEYRKQMERYKRFIGHLKPSQDTAGIFTAQLKHADRLRVYLDRFNSSTPKQILEIGCSSGGILAGLRSAYGSHVVGVEPGPDEASYARGQGIEIHEGVFEDLAHHLQGGFDLIICTQTFNHLLNPLFVARAARELLNDNGFLLVECQNFLRLCRDMYFLENAVQIDHTYMFVPSTLQKLLEVAGFGVLEESIEYSAWAPGVLPRGQANENELHMRMLAQGKSSVVTVEPQYEFVRREIDRVPRLRLRRLVADLAKMAIQRD